jgi:feruloyl esterase
MRGSSKTHRERIKTMNLNSVLRTALLALVIGAGATPAAAGCLELAKLALPHTTITAAESIAAGTYKAPNGEVFTNMPAFCRIAVTLTPTSDSNIKIEVWMPFTGWNGKIFSIGNGNIGGTVRYGGLAVGLRLNYAAATTDLGTSPAATDPQGGLVLIGHPEKQIDYATRSTHLMTVRAKQIIRSFYGEAAKRSYFLGCSTGGGQGVHEALQFPGDYDGIYAGAPSISPTHQAAAFIWNYGAFDGGCKDCPAQVNAAQMTAVSAAIVKKCAGKDGGLPLDNFLTDPRDCQWFPASLQCTGKPGEAGTTCLTRPQVTGLKKFYEGPFNPRTGERIIAGRVRGSESNAEGPVALEALSQPGGVRSGNAPYWVFGADFDWRTFDFDRDMDTVDEALAARLNANTAELDQFKSHGGKIILWHGFADPQIPTLATVAYYERLIASQTRGHGEHARAEGLRRTQEFARLFLAPGVGHCGGGAGPDTFDPLPALEQWVEHGVAPDRIIASKVSGGVMQFTRPLCPYPALPRYKKVGDPKQADSFACAEDHDHDNNQPPAPRYLDDGHNFPLPD